jgi:uncharacterized protein (DUF433 family)
MGGNYIERRETGLYIAGSRVPIDRIVSEYRKGEDARTIQAHFPTLSLDQIEGAIAFYSSHKDEVDRVIEHRRQSEHAYDAEHPTPADVKQRFERMRRHMASRRS